MAPSARKRASDSLVDNATDRSKNVRLSSSLKRRRVTPTESAATEDESDPVVSTTDHDPSIGLTAVARHRQYSRARKDKDAGAAVSIAAGDSEKPYKTTSASGQPSHVRFGSEEPAALPPALATTERAAIPDSDADGNEDESEDDAPEAVSASTAREVAQGTAKDARKAVAALQSDARNERRQKDAKRQAQAAKTKAFKAAVSTIKVESDNDTDRSGDDEDATATVTRKHNRRQALPDFLPDSVLADPALLAPRDPTPPPRGKHIRLDGDDKQGVTEPPRTAESVIRKRERKEAKARREHKVGPLYVSVLEKLNRRLAPKVVKNSRSIKEAWLAGRAGGVKAGSSGAAKSRGAVEVERVAWAKGFVKR